MNDDAPLARVLAVAYSVRAVSVAVAIKLSQAATVALGQKVEPRVVPEPVKIGLCSPGRMSFRSGWPSPPIVVLLPTTVPLGFEPRMNSRTNVRACKVQSG